MKLSRQTIILILIPTFIILGILVAGFWLYQNYYLKQTSITFEPPYPETNTNGDPILAVFVGRVPCDIKDCEWFGKLKVELVLYQNRGTKTPTTYWLGLIGLDGNNRTVTRGIWTILQGIKDYPKAVAYKLDSNTRSDFQLYWRVNENILLPLDQEMNPKVGHSGWGYMLSRSIEPYGPRTYFRTLCPSITNLIKWCYHDKD